jgi:ATP-dependent Clp protease ATP-binding subunit ClpC
MDEEALDFEEDDDEIVDVDDNGQDLVISTDPIVVTNYSVHARNVLRAAEAAAATAPGGAMTSEHLLLSLCDDPECAAAQVLEQIGFTADRISGTIAFVVGPQAGGEPGDAVVLSPRVERVLTDAGIEAGNRKATQIDTLHLLIALVRLRQGVAALALETPGVGHEPVGAAISQAMRNGLTDPS